MPDASDPRTPRARILVAEDEPHIRRVLQTLLELPSFEVDFAQDGDAALTMLEGKREYDLAILDLMMPGASGLEVLARIRGSGRSSTLPVVILTAKGQDADREEALALGASAFMTKPFSPKKLLARIDELLGQ
jgi:DNA-binding response OmpR family regulator